MSTSFGHSLCNVQCQCGHEADFEDFTIINGVELAQGHYQCPKCHRAWQIVKAPIRISKFTGELIHEPNKIIPTQPRLL